MQVNKPWIKELNINQEHVSRWQQQLAPNESLTFWCLIHKKIDSKSYMAWARNHYELASISEEYFLQHQYDLSFWEQIKNVANWSESMLPIAQWDGIIFIGCVEPIKNQHWSFPVRYILTEADTLKKQWQNLNHISQENKTPPEAESIEHSNNEATAIGEIQSLESQALTQEIENNEVTAISNDNNQSNNETTTIDGPEGLDLSQFNIEAPKKDSLSFETTSLNEVPAKTINEENEIPEGLTLNLEMPAAAPEDQTITNIFNESTTSTNDEATTIDESLLQTEPTTTQAVEQPAHTENNEPSTQVPTPVISEEPTTTPENITDLDEYKENVAVKKITNLNEATNEKDIASFFFEQLRQEFTHCMMLIFKGYELTPWIWDTKWTPTSKNAFNSIDLKTPSPFRIANKTKRSYHGHIIENEVIDKFLSNWGIKEKPGCLTLCPLKQSDHVFGMMLCLGDEEKRTHHTLSFAEKICDQFVDEIQDINKKAS